MRVARRAGTTQATSATKRGEFSDASELIAAAVRYYAERHRDSD